MKKKTAPTDQNLSPALVNLGLTIDEAKCYTVLSNEGSLSASSLAKNIGILPNAVYRLIYGLKEKGFVVELDTRPVKFQAISPSVAIEAYSQAKIKNLEELKTSAINDLANKPGSSQTKIDILTGRSAMFARGAELIREAKKEVLIISIGEPVPDEIKLANRDALEKGVSIKFIAHKYDKDNADLLKSWVKMGLEVRHFPDKGYHLSVTDGAKTLLSTSNPANPAERVSMVINSVDLSNAIRNYFYSVWEKALPIS
jgi:sugar-specific transcriptional regulator TrmB